MLNIGMTELLCFAIIALLVLGPEKLPEGARFAAKWYGKIKKFIANVQGEIDRELRLSEFREEMQKEIEKITELEVRLQQQLDALKRSSTEQTQPSASPFHPFNVLPTSPPSPFSQAHIQNFWADIQLKQIQSVPPIELKIAV